MKILCLTPLKHLPEVFKTLCCQHSVIYRPALTENELKRVLEHEKDIDALFVNPNKQTYKLSRSVLMGSSVRLINSASTGLNHIDLQACVDFNITVLSLKTDSSLIDTLPSTAELAFGLMLSLLRKIPTSYDSVKEGHWDYLNFVGRQAAGLTIGIIGYGRLGRLMAKYCAAFDMNVLVYDPYKSSDSFPVVSLSELAAKSDVISLHVHVTTETEDLIDHAFLKQVIRKPYLINTSRGDIVNEEAVVESLAARSISGYATDVLKNEFDLIADSPVLNAAKNGLPIIITPHTGGMTWEGQTRAYSWAIDKFNHYQF
jgi:D-3-phosphoglycerate dehydrogenase / 2-oxoglutarate reductase